MAKVVNTVDKNINPIARSERLFLATQKSCNLIGNMEFSVIKYVNQAGPIIKNWMSLEMMLLPSM